MSDQLRSSHGRPRLHPDDEANGRDVMDQGSASAATSSTHPAGSSSSTTTTTTPHRHSTFSLRSPTRAPAQHHPAAAAPPSLLSDSVAASASSSSTANHHHHHHHRHHHHHHPDATPGSTPSSHHHHHAQPSSATSTSRQHHHHHHHHHHNNLPAPFAAAPAHSSSAAAAATPASTSAAMTGGSAPGGLPPLGPGASSPNANHHQHHPHHQSAPARPRSPLRPSSGYYPPAGDAHHPPRDSKPPGSFYDPLTDTTMKDRSRVSDSWHNPPPSASPKSREAYPYHPPSSAEAHQPAYYNGHYTASRDSRPSPSYNRPRSPPTHSHPSLPVGSRSPPTRQPHMASPTHHRAPLSSTPNGSASLLSKSDLRAVSPLRPAAPALSSTPSRADPMSFSNILSSAEPARPRSPPPAIAPAPAFELRVREHNDDTEVEKDIETETEHPSVKGVDAAAVKKKSARRSTKGRASDIRDAAAPKSRRASSRKESTPRGAAKRQADGQPKPKTWSPEMEKKISNYEEKIDNETAQLDPNEFDETEYKQHAQKRRRLMDDVDTRQQRMRRDDFSDQQSKRLLGHAELGKRRYDDMYYDTALQEVREQEVFAEKERKKDMQRKRRREKSMAVTMELKEAALARAEAAEDDEERQKHLRDAERASKKAQQTKLILQKGIKGPARNLEMSFDGSMSSFVASDAESGPKKKGRGGSRPKKSKEQKQAEKDSAVAAQAALDAGEELPAKEEGKVRIKIKGRSKKDGGKEKEKIEGKEKVDDVPEADKKFISKGYNQIYDQIWRDMARKDVNKTFKLAVDSYATKSSNLKKTAILASKEAKRWQLRTNKGTKDLQARAKRVMRDMMGFWKRNEREERDLRKAAEKQELENARKEDAERESARQKRKLNFLISQTELYSHFIGKKIKTDEVERSTDNPEIAPDGASIPQSKMNIAESTGPVAGKVTNFEDLDFDAEDESTLQAAAVANAQNAIAEAQQKARAFNQQGLDMDDEGEMNFQNPTGLDGEVEIAQPKLLNAQLKEYQLKGLNWLVNLYEQGINGILADEMGLGKTVQSISVMAYLAEKHDIWGPFLVVAPASTLHNWQQEIVKFLPDFKILPYWGSAADRKVLRKFWDRKHSTYRKDAAFHVCVTSYQLVVSDVAYFQKMRWQYMILDEAQAIKSSQSSRWKSLLGFHCRNRLLLTGTPIQNNMQELWALLHFIMPSLFDSHDEFSEWFSKDIESHAQSNTKLNEDQLKRLHMILKPFMLRRVKKHVQKELGDKIELDVFCDLTYRQRAIYANLRNQINIMDLMEKATLGDDQDSSTLMNLVMQFRKVCNHPDLFERADVTSPYSFGYFAETASFLREGNKVTVGYSSRSLIDYKLPALVWNEGGRLYKAGNDNRKAGWRNKALNHMMNIWTPNNIQENANENKAFSWLRFADASAGEVYKTVHKGVFDRAADELAKSDRLSQFAIAYDDEDENFSPGHALFKIAERNNRKPLADITKEGILSRLMNISGQSYDDSGMGRLDLAGRPRVSAPPLVASSNSVHSEREAQDVLFNVPIRKKLYGTTPNEEQALVQNRVPFHLYPQPKVLPEPDNEKRRFTNIDVPSMRRFVTDSGKLAKLDELLFKLKNENHRVLLYFQMTRMIDMMEEYLTYRNYKYCRLDGSTKLEDRRDTVADFQTRPDIFIFLLSTRAGGLGINLTAADTVIFYDSDWNPTIDSQAMDRAHRLGQTRQVTVYRLITRGTIEERIRKRAMQKEEVQRVVIQGGGASVDFSGRRAPENRNRDIAMWLADDEQAEMIERREKELIESGELDAKKKKSSRKKKAEASASLDDMYHEGEGHFDDGSRAGASGTATPAESEPKKRGRKPGGKKAKTAKQRLAMADGMVDG
ncbi:SNF2 family helicase ATPase (Ino80) [Cordyceps militaris]|uniref:Chromatin-remodeling ATPase INO80 n=1 Tax=Cordyceps militaris TaxID=73501 RepID=A0A2H4SIS9_CORMI|nr:SNF2 family helicase ATPase (Ino80) [Cordyceps militaris]